MPTIDPELFQLIVLGLLAVNLLATLGVLSALSKIRSAVQSPAPIDVTPAAAPLAAQPAAAQSWAQPEPTTTTAAYASPLGGGDVGLGGAGAGGLAGGMGAATGGLEPAPGAAPLGTQPVATGELAGTGAGAGTATAAEPSDQPFERDGRWWFRRGEELLLYDEATGQWQPAPAGSAPGAGYAPGPAAGAGVEQAGGVGGSFWKCPACGAVNGSTATSCRMCFTARP